MVDSNKVLMCLKRTYNTFKENPDQEMRIKEIIEKTNLNIGNWSRMKKYIEILLYFDIIEKKRNAKCVTKYKLKK
jgi:predicted transcriptional regulator